MKQLSKQDLKFFDSHLHIIEPGFPLISNNSYVPDYFTVEDYLQLMAPYNLVGGVVVSGSFQGFDQDYLAYALSKLGPGFAGVTQLPATTPDAEILRLQQLGVRGLRFNLKRGGSEDIKHLSALAARVHEIAGWHVELYVDSAKLFELEPVLLNLPKVCIDHLGLSCTGFDVLLKLVEHGIHVKASGFGRVDFDVAQALREIYTINPDTLMFGTDLPSTRAPRPFKDNDLMIIIENLDESGVKHVLYENAIKFYNISEKNVYSK